MKTVIIGLGNPILSDDSVGIKVSRALHHTLNGCSGIDITEVYAGGIRLMDAMTGYDRAVIIDAVVTEHSEPGRYYRLSLSDLVSTRNTVSVHDMNLPTALEMGRMLDVPLPEHIDIWGIEAKDVETFSEGLSEAVAQAVPAVVSCILQDLGLSDCANNHARW
ncbi:MAG: hydrogenase maturation protease [Nitrospirota bacterium]